METSNSSYIYIYAPKVVNFPVSSTVTGGAVFHCCYNRTPTLTEEGRHVENSKHTCIETVSSPVARYDLGIAALPV